MLITRKSDQDLNIVIIDPGLMELGGHHAGLVSSLADDIEHGKKANLTIISHRELDARLLERLNKLNIKIFKHFKTNFYGLMTESSTLNSLDKPIACLAREYERALKLALATSEGELIIFIPCIAWQHAIALYTAILWLKKNLRSSDKLRFKIAACAMFNPGVTLDNAVIDNTLYFNNQLVFGWLLRHEECEIYASDIELSLAFKFALGQKLPFPIHPSYLVNWSHFRSILKNTVRDPNLIILYSGDAKKEKGFCELPDVIAWCLTTYPQKKLVVQYTVNWLMPELDSTIAELEKLAKKYSQITLHREYWETDTLLRYFAEASAIALLYSASAYQHKSSGMLWLAAFAKLDIWVAGKSWLTREASRLGIKTYLVCSENEKISLTHLSLKGEGFPDYDKMLFKDIWDWFEELENIHE